MLLEGGSLSQRFSRLPLSCTQPAFIGGFYALLISVAVLLPHLYANGWTQETLRDWTLLTVSVILMGSVMGLFSSLTCRVTRRPPVPLRRALLYPMPFAGLVIFTVWMVTDLELGLPEAVQLWGRRISLLLMLLPGPIYVHLSWAPRWRLLCRLEEGLDPFDGAVPVPPRAEVEAVNGDPDMEQAIEDLAELPPLNGGGSEEE